jgi:hypothetical protein
MAALALSLSCATASSALAEADLNELIGKWIVDKSFDVDVTQKAEEFKGTYEDGWVVLTVNGDKIKAETNQHATYEGTLAKDKKMINFRPTGGGAEKYHCWRREDVAADKTSSCE